MNKGINKCFIGIYIGVSSLFFVHLLFHISFKLFGEGENLEDVYPSFCKYIKNVYLPIICTIALSHGLSLFVKPVPLYFYYYIWIRCFYGTLKQWEANPNSYFKRTIAHWLIPKVFNDYFDKLILESFPKEIPKIKEQIYSDKVQEMSFYNNRPVLIRREHLMEKSFWHVWAFAIVLLFKRLKIERNCTKGKIKFSLEIDLRKQSYGIYNNAGKAFLRTKFLNNEFKFRCLGESNKIQEFLKTKSDHSDTCTIKADEMPLRWASGGMLPIASWKSKYWFVLFFRDISPVGWNIANGASETKEEYKNLRSLIYREFSEELVLLNREPALNDQFPIKQKLFKFPAYSDEDSPNQEKIKEFTKMHRQLRREHDNLLIDSDSENGQEIKPISTPFKVRIVYHDSNLKDVISFEIPDVIFNINPTEFGIEVLLVSSFEMDDNDYLLDGEIWENGPALVRQPIMLLSCDYVQKLFDEYRTLGTYIEDPPYLNCKYLNKIPVAEYKIFYKDIEFRDRRLELLKKNRKTEESYEATRNRAWFQNYGSIFTDIKNLGCDITYEKHKPLATLCPVTWKSLELICHHKLLRNIS